MLTQYVRSREAEVARTMAGDTEHLAAHHLHSLRRLSLVSHASQRHHDLTEKEELAAFHTTITHVTTQVLQVRLRCIGFTSQINLYWYCKPD